MKAHYTSRSHSTMSAGRAYRGVLTAPPAATSIALDPSDPAATQCSGCGAYVRRLKHGQPRAHAPGGYTTSIKQGRYPCEGSGTLAPAPPPVE